MKNISLIIILFFIPYIQSQTFDWQKEGVFGYPGTIMSTFPIEAAAAGLANAYTARTTGAMSPWWTPAGLANLANAEITFYTAPMYFQTEFSALGLAVPVTFRPINEITRLKDNAYWGNAGFIVSRLETKNIERTNNLSEITGTFNSSELITLISYARKLSPTFFIGINLRAITQEIAQLRNTNWGVDCGLQFLLFGSNLRADMAIQNINIPQLNLTGEIEKVPLTLRNGIKVQFFRRRLQMCIDLTVINAFSKEMPLYTFAGGLEYKVVGPLNLRTGLNHREFTLGLGINWREADLDYAVSLHFLGITHRASFSYRFGFIPSEEEKRITELRRELKKETDLYRHHKSDEGKQQDKLQQREMKKNITRLLQEINQLIKEKKYSMADNEINRLELLDPDNRQVEQLKEIIRNNLPGATLVIEYDNLIKLYNQQNYTQVVQISEKIISTQADTDNIPVKIIYYLSRGYLAINQGDYQLARTAFRTVLDFDPLNEEATMMVKRVDTILATLFGK